MGERSQGKLTLEELLHAANAPILDVSDAAIPDEPVSDLLRDLLGGAEEPRDDGGLLEQLQDLPRIPVAAAPPVGKPEERVNEPADGKPPAAEASGEQPAAELVHQGPLADAAPDEEPPLGAAPVEEPLANAVSEEPCALPPAGEPAAKQGEPPGQPGERPPRRLGRHAAGTSAGRARRREAERQQAASLSAPEAPKQSDPSSQLAVEPITQPAPAPQQEPTAPQREHALQCESAPKGEARPAPAPLTLSDLTEGVETFPAPVSSTAETPSRHDARGAQLRALRQQLERRMRDLAAGEPPTSHERVRRETPASSASADKPRLTTDAPSAASGTAAHRPPKGPAHARPAKCTPSRSRRLKVAAATVGVLVLVAVFATASGLAGAPFGFPSLPGDAADSATPSETDAGGASPEGKNNSAAPGSPGKSKNESEKESSAGKAGVPSTENRSGTVVYRYVASSADGEGCTVIETVRFGRDGFCETSTMEASFAEESESEAFLEALRRDYGSAFQDGAAEGSTATATLDVSANKLDREAYEDALRDSVQDLSIVRKS